MKKIFTLLFFGLILSGCSFGTSTSTSQNSESSISQNPTSTEPSTSTETSTNTTKPDIDLEELKELYGEFSITTEKGAEPILSSDGKTYTISVSSSKSAYSLSGYFEGQIIINNENGLSSLKGVELTLNGACLVSNSGSTIDYTVDDKNVEIVAKKNTENYIINTSDDSNDHAVLSDKNIEVDGKGILNILTKTGHALKAEKKVRFYDAFTLNITAGHDAIHASDFISNNEEELEEDYEEFTGTLNVLSAVSQAFDCTTSKGKGTITLTSGTYNISNCESVFKTDVSLTIGAMVIANNLSGDPVVRGDNASDSVTIEITDTGSFTVDGVDYTNS